jgi:hypothetical protein
MRDQTVHNKKTEELSRGCAFGMTVEGKTEREDRTAGKKESHVVWNGSMTSFLFQKIALLVIREYFLSPSFHLQKNLYMCLHITQFSI